MRERASERTASISSFAASVAVAAAAAVALVSSTATSSSRKAGRQPARKLRFILPRAPGKPESETLLLCTRSSSEQRVPPRGRLRSRFSTCRLRGGTRCPGQGRRHKKRRFALRLPRRPRDRKPQLPSWLPCPRENYGGIYIYILEANATAAAVTTLCH